MDYCYQQLVEPFQNSCSCQSIYVESVLNFCNEHVNSPTETDVVDPYSYRDDEYNKPMLLIGMYISIAMFVCILAIALDLLYGFRRRKFWFPSKYFSLNAVSITVIAVAMKLPVDLSSSMPGLVEQLAKFGGMAFMCTMMANLLPSLASMDNNSLFANVIGLSIFVITFIVNIFIQVRTHVINPNMFDNFLMQFFRVIVTYIYMGMLLFLLIILISSAITIPSSKKILEFKYKASSKRALNHQDAHRNQVSTVEELRQLVERYWIMAETGSPQFVLSSSPLSSASGIICTLSMVIYIFLVSDFFLWHYGQKYGSVYKWSVVPIAIIQSIGIVVGSVAPIFRCFTFTSFESFFNQDWKYFSVFQVEKYWTQKLYGWKESHISFFSNSRRSRALLHDLKNHILSFCIGFQKVIVVSCKIIGLIPTMVIMFVNYFSYSVDSLKAMMFTPPTASNSDDINKELSDYVLLLEDNIQLAEKTMKGISDSMYRLIQNAEKNQPNNLLKLLETSIAFDGVETFDNDQSQSLLSVEHVNSWSLPIITCIAIAIWDNHMDKIDKLLKSVGEGLLYTHAVEESLNKESVYVNIRRATMTLWHEVEYKCKWLETTLERSAYDGKTPTEIITSFAHKAEGIVNEFNTYTNGELMEIENLPPKVIAANSMYRVVQTIIHTYKSNNLEITEDELFARLSVMISEILAACLTNMPRVITMRCQESVIEKREASVLAAINLFGRSTEIIKVLETRELPNMDPDKMGFIDEWRLHLKQP